MGKYAKGVAVLRQACRMACLLSVWFGGVGAEYARSTPGEPPAYCTMFHHMVKAGGSSIKSRLQRASVMEGLGKPGQCLSGPTNEQACADAMSNSAVTAGYTELLRCPLQHSGRDCEFFTVFRHPIDRLVSAFFYCPKDHDVQHRPTKWCGFADDPQPATERLVEFAREAWGNLAFRQMSLGLCCNGGTFCEGGKAPSRASVDEPAGWDMLGEIMGLLNTYNAVGILEHWDLTMQLFNVRVKSPVRDWQEIVKTNAGQQSGLRSDVLKWAHDSPEVLHILATDILLYDHAVAVFKEQTAASLGTVWE